MDIFFRRLFLFGVLVVFLYALILLTPVLAVFVAGFALAYLLNPLVELLARGMSRLFAIVLVYFLAVLGAFWILRISIPLLWHQVQIGWNYLPVAINWYNAQGRFWITRQVGYDLPALNTADFTAQVLPHLQANFQVVDAQGVLQSVFDLAVSVASNAGLLLLVPVLTFYFLYSWHERLAQFKRLLPKQHAPLILALVRDCHHALMAFVQGQILVMVLLGLTYALLLQYMAGLDLGLTIGLLAGLASFVPYMGFVVGFVAAIIAGFFEFGADAWHLGLIVLSFGIGQVAESYVFQPLLLGDKIGLSPLWVIFALLAGGSLFGFWGMIVALPVAAVLAVLVRYGVFYYQRSAVFLGPSQLNLFEMPLPDMYATPQKDTNR